MHSKNCVELGRLELQIPPSLHLHLKRPSSNSAAPEGALLLPRASRLVQLGCEEGLGLASIFWSWLLGVDPLNRPAGHPVSSVRTHLSRHPGQPVEPVQPVHPVRPPAWQCQPTAARSPHPRARSRSSLSPSPFTPSFPPTSVT